MASAFALRGSTELEARLLRLAQRVPTAFAAALFEEAEIEMTEAKERTPVDLGALKNSGTVHPPEIGRTISVRLTFGNVAVDYAVYVHEDLEAFHRVGQAKYLESVLMESRPFLGARVARRVDLGGLAR